MVFEAHALGQHQEDGDEREGGGEAKSLCSSSVLLSLSLPSPHSLGDGGDGGLGRDAIAGGEMRAVLGGRNYGDCM